MAQNPIAQKCHLLIFLDRFGQFHVMHFAFEFTASKGATQFDVQSFAISVKFNNPQMEISIGSEIRKINAKFT